MSKPFAKISYKFNLVVLSIAAAFAITLSVIAPGYLREMVYSSTKRLMLEQAERISSSESLFSSLESYLFTGSAPDYLDTYIAVYDRVLVINNSALIIYDSCYENSRYNQRFLSAEIQKALAGENTFLASFDKTSFTFNVYAPIYLNGNIRGVIFFQNIDPSLAVRYRQINDSLRFITVILCLLPLGFGIFTAIRFNSRLRTVVFGIRKVKSGDYSHHIAINGNDELAELADELNELRVRHAENEEMRARFVSDASHELRTPLASIKLLSDSILQTPDMETDEIKEFLCDINDEIDRLTRISGKLLQITRFDDLTGKARLAPLDLEPVIKNVCRMLTPLAAASNGSIKNELMPGCMVMANYDLMYQVFYNIIENAIKYGGQNHDVRVYLYKRDGFAITLIDDEGDGIPEEDLKKIFDRFYRVDKARARATGGTGLGLSIVASAVHICNGTVEAQNRPNGGARFTVKFPLVEEGE